MRMLNHWRLRRPADDNETVYVSERNGVRMLHIGSDTVQSAMRLARPNDLELAYTRSMMAFLLFNPEPRSAMIVGLGGGSIVKFLHHRLPALEMDVVEINPQVVAIARQCFHLPPDDARMQVHIGDGAEFVGGPGEAVDVVIVDGYDAEAQVEDLASVEFYRNCLSRLTPAGIAVTNLWSGERSYLETLLRWRTVFPATLCLPASKPGNVAVMGFASDPDSLDWQSLRRRARALEPHFGLEFGRFVEGLRELNDHDESAVKVMKKHIFT